MKLSVLLNSFRTTFPESLNLAYELDLDGIQLDAMAGDSPLVEMAHTEILDVRRAIEEHGLEISAICGDLPGYGFEIRSDNVRKISRMHEIIDIASLIGTSIITCHIGVIPSDSSSDKYDAMLSALDAIGTYASQYGVSIAIETGPEPSEVLRDFISSIPSKAIKVNLDPANLLMVLNEDPISAVETLRDYIVHTHAKDGVHYKKSDPVSVYHSFAEGGFELLQKRTGKLFEEKPLGKGQINWQDYLFKLREINYDGFLTIERETGVNPYDDIRQSVSFLQELLRK